MVSRLVEQHKPRGATGFQPEKNNREARAPKALAASLKMVLYLIEL
jgi:hypothetical protein